MFAHEFGHALHSLSAAITYPALGGTPLRRLPSYVVPQYGAKAVYLPPSFGQAKTLRHFAKIGLTANGYREPAGWGLAERAALQQGYEDGQASLDALIASQSAGADTNYWTILNDMIGTYPNSVVGYLVRSTIVLNGGSANVPLDAVYPKLLTSNGTDALDGNQTYTLTFTPPVAGAPLPVEGIFPEGTPFPIEEGATIPGFFEGLKQMQKGGKYVLFIPADKAYGAEPPQGAPIPPNADLEFEIEVIDVMSQKTFERNLGILQQAMQSQMGGAGAPGAGPAPAPEAAPAQ